MGSLARKFSELFKFGVYQALNGVFFLTIIISGSSPPTFMYYIYDVICCSIPEFGGQHQTQKEKGKKFRGTKMRKRGKEKKWELGPESKLVRRDGILGGYIP